MTEEEYRSLGVQEYRGRTVQIVSKDVRPIFSSKKLEMQGVILACFFLKIGHSLVLVTFTYCCLHFLVHHSQLSHCTTD